MLKNLRRDQNNALAGERWSEANQIQRVIMVLLDAAAGPHPGSLSMEEMTTIRNIFSGCIDTTETVDWMNEQRDFRVMLQTSKV